ncbi:hypothetical protein [Halomarina rubra]|uniref:PH domain-containing protein n=1 Tax=Halomarina rubra TaxID=2071873 RepID=A0ABD6ARN5_9EURY|nr:hypothetical protein [Halomarina rubra]
MASTTHFREVQRFRQWWLWAILGVVGLVSVVSGGPIGILVAGGIVVFVWSLSLTTEVRNDGLYIQLWPLQRSFQRVPWTAIESAEAVRYRPLREYGGWGIRWRPGTVAYSVSGSRGVFVSRDGDRDILVGSERPDELETAIREQLHTAVH